MRSVYLNIKMELLEDLLLGFSQNSYGAESTILNQDQNGRPIMPGSTLKGLLKESIQNYLCWTGNDNSTLLESLFSAPAFSRSFAHRLTVSDLKLEETDEDWRSRRMRLQMANGRIRKVTSIPCIAAGHSFYGTILCCSRDVSLIIKGLQGIHWVGTMRNRGMGSVRFSVTDTIPLTQTSKSLETHWLHYRLRVDSPLIISQTAKNNYGIQGNVFMDSHNYLPGAAVRGMVMDNLRHLKPHKFLPRRKQLLDQVYFGNALPSVEGKDLIPTPKGFYSDKQQTCFYSVLEEDVRPGHKRAELGSFCYLQDGIIHHHSPVMTQRVQVSSDHSTTFFCKAIAAGTELSGYIYFRDPALASLVSDAFSGPLNFGALRYAGNGQCTLLELSEKAPDSFRYGYSAGDAVDSTLYMMMLSGCTMSRHGQSGGLDTEELAQLLDVPEVQLHRCATSVMDVGGFNSKWKASLPTSVMYSPGSIFRLFFPKGVPTPEKLEALQYTGIGMRAPEGFGQVIFLKDFPGLHRAQRIFPQEKERLDAAHFRSLRCRWLLDTPLPKSLSEHSLARLEILGRNSLAGTRRPLRSYLDSSTDDGLCSISQLLETPLGETLNCPGYPDSMDARIRLLVDWIDLNRKRGD